MSTCVKCGGTRWEMVEPQIAKVDGKWNFIQCADCGGVVGVVDSQRISLKLTQIQRHVALLVGSRV